MERQIILLSGHVASGKTTLARNLAKRFDMTLLRTRDWLKSTLGNTGHEGRAALQREGDRLDRQTRGRWVLEGLARELRGGGTRKSVVVDSVRIPAQIAAVREAYGSLVTHIHMTAPLRVLAGRYSRRQQDANKSDTLTYDDVRSNATESMADKLSELADVVINSDRCTEGDVLVRVACRLGLFGEASTGYVDVVVGGQYGSEGKGQIAAFLARELRPPGTSGRP